MEGRSHWGHILRGAGWIIVCASLIGIVVNLSFVVDVLKGEKTFNAEERVEEILRNSRVKRITLAEAKRFFDETTAIFVDSRSDEEYADGHIPGAVHMPWEEFDTFSGDLPAFIPRGTTIIAYCGGSCESSAELADALAELGYPEANVFLDGWPLWVEAGYPVETLK